MINHMKDHVTMEVMAMVTRMTEMNLIWERKRNFRLN